MVESAKIVPGSYEDMKNKGYRIVRHGETNVVPNTINTIHEKSGRKAYKPDLTAIISQENGGENKLHNLQAGDTLRVDKAIEFAEDPNNIIRNLQNGLKQFMEIFNKK